MASKLYLTYFSRQAVDRESKPIAAPDWSSQIGDTEVLDYSAGADRSAVFPDDARFMRMHTDSICSIKFGDSTVTAGTSDARMVAGQTEFAGIAPGQYVSAITNT